MVKAIFSHDYEAHKRRLKSLKLIVMTLTFAGLSACNFNSRFLYPTIPPENAKQLTLTTPGDTTMVVFNGEAFQPTFLKNRKDTVDFNFNIESVVFTSSSGNSLNGWLLKPKNKKPTITILHFHGNAGFIVSEHEAISPLADYGFQIFTFDYSGFGFSEGKAKRKNIIKDANAALDYLKNRDDVSSTKLVIYGQSLGGNLAAMIAAEREEDIDGVVIEGGFSSFKDIAAEYYGFLGKILVKENQAGFKAIENYHKPLLVIHSAEDKVVPLKLGRKIFEFANEPKEFYEIDGCHICSMNKYGKIISIKIDEMVE